jgi:hypothetical protein
VEKIFYCKEHKVILWEEDDDHCVICEADTPQKGFFYYFPVSDLLRKFWSEYSWWAKACYYPWEERRKLNADPAWIGMHQILFLESSCVFFLLFSEDIYDAPVWKQYHQLQTAGNMGFALNTDGINFFNSSSHSAWPCYLENMNLAPSHR